MPSDGSDDAETWRSEYDRNMQDGLQSIQQAQNAARRGTQAAATASALLELVDCMHAYTTDGFPGSYPEYEPSTDEPGADDSLPGTRRRRPDSVARVTYLSQERGELERYLSPGDLIDKPADRVEVVALDDGGDDDAE